MRPFFVLFCMYLIGQPAYAEELSACTVEKLAIREVRRVESLIGPVHAGVTAQSFLTYTLSALWSAAGDGRRALTVAKTISDPLDQARSYVAIFNSLDNRSENAIAEIVKQDLIGLVQGRTGDTPVQRSLILWSALKVLTRMGEFDQAIQLSTEFAEGHGLRAKLGYITYQMARHGDLEGALDHLNDWEQTGSWGNGRNEQDWLNKAFAYAYMGEGKWHDAIIYARRINKEMMRNDVISFIATHLVENNRLSDAEAVSHQLKNDQLQTRILIEIALAYMHQNNAQVASRLRRSIMMRLTDSRWDLSAFYMWNAMTKLDVGLGFYEEAQQAFMSTVSAAYGNLSDPGKELGQLAAELMEQSENSISAFEVVLDGLPVLDRARAGRALIQRGHEEIGWEVLSSAEKRWRDVNKDQRKELLIEVAIASGLSGKCQKFDELMKRASDEDLSPSVYDHIQISNSLLVRKAFDH